MEPSFEFGKCPHELGATTLGKSNPAHVWRAIRWPSFCFVTESRPGRNAPYQRAVNYRCFFLCELVLLLASWAAGQQSLLVCTRRRKNPSHPACQNSPNMAGHLGQPAPRCARPLGATREKDSRVGARLCMQAGNGGGRSWPKGPKVTSEVPSTASGLMLQPGLNSSSAQIPSRKSGEGHRRGHEPPIWGLARPCYQNPWDCHGSPSAARSSTVRYQVSQAGHTHHCQPPAPGPARAFSSFLGATSGISPVASRPDRQGTTQIDTPKLSALQLHVLES